MDSQASDTVVPVERRTIWTHMVFASVAAHDHDVSDEEIYALLNADSDGESAADLCAARGVTLPMYCVWKTKYRHLTADELRRARRREILRARCLRAALLIGAALAIGVLGLVLVSGLGRTAHANVARAAEPAAHPAAEARARMAPRAADSRQTHGASSDTVAAEPGTHSAATAPIIDSGYIVQVAAAASPQEARVLVDRLAAAGHRAYISRATVKQVEVYRVRIGPFETRAAAEEVAVPLRGDGYAGTWVAR